jgi:hypothetical protein
VLKKKNKRKLQQLENEIKRPKTEKAPGARA